MPFSLALGEAAHPETAAMKEMSGQRSAGRVHNSPCLPPSAPIATIDRASGAQERCLLAQEILPRTLPCAPVPFQLPEQYFEIYGKLIIDYRCALVQGR